MAQDFEVINLDNCCDPNKSRCIMSGEFGEWFPMADRIILVDALWVPEPGHKHIVVKPYSELRLDIFKADPCRRPPPPQIVRAVTRLLLIPTQPLMTPYKSISSLANETGNGSGQLPTEIVDLVYWYLEDLLDVLRFAATCQRFYEIGRRHIEIFISATLIDAWAGNRLICLGDYAYMVDLPSDMLTDTEFEFLKGKFRAYSVYTRLCAIQELDPLWYIRSTNTAYRELSYGSQLSSFFYTIGRRYNDNKVMMDLDSALVLNDLITESAVRPPSQQLTSTELYSRAYVLRNLTTKEFIRGNTIRDLWVQPKYSFMRDIRFNHALIIRIMCSSLLSFGYDGPIQIHRGIWAGHRFDLNRINTVWNEEGVVEGWKDVSQEVLNEVVEVWQHHAQEPELSAADWSDWSDNYGDCY